MHAVQSAEQLKRSNVALLLLSAGHLTLAHRLAASHGAAGLVVADAANMCARIAYSLAHIRGAFAALPGFRLARLLPCTRTVAAAAAASAVALASRAALLPPGLDDAEFLRRAAAHVAVGAAALAALAGAAARWERESLSGALALRRAGGQAKRE